ncbi:hypothetical protein KSU66_04540 [Sporosarcina sp. G11-34]|nr:hypothetical protein [Sporosarcina sp. G11-34]
MKGWTFPWIELIFRVKEGTSPWIELTFRVKERTSPDRAGIRTKRDEFHPSR